jgi:hypothetical protein
MYVIRADVFYIFGAGGWRALRFFLVSCPDGEELPGVVHGKRGVSWSNVRITTGNKVCLNEGSKSYWLLMFILF